MCIKVTMHLTRDVEQALVHAGLSSFMRIMRYRGIETVSRAGKRKVRKVILDIDGQEKCFYLKQILLELPKTVLKNIRKGAGRHTNACLEYKQIQAYKDLGIPVMTASGWGELSVCGWPVSGFVLLDEVPGIRLDQRLQHASPKERQQLLYTFGTLIKKLHDSNIDTVTRIQDVVCVPPDDAAGNDHMVLIDREHGSLIRSPIPGGKIQELLAKTYLKACQHFGSEPFTSRELLAFVTGYTAGQNTTRTERRQFIESIEQSAIDLVKNTRKYQDCGIKAGG